MHYKAINRNGIDEHYAAKQRNGEAVHDTTLHARLDSDLQRLGIYEISTAQNAQQWQSMSLNDEAIQCDGKD